MNNSGSGVRGNPFGAPSLESDQAGKDSARKFRRPWLAGILAALFFITAIFFYTRHNSFSYILHPDEPSKVRQIVTGKRNFRHPLLLLSTSALALRLSSLSPTAQNAAIAGRSCSALFAAAAVATLALLAYQQRGLSAMMLAGALVLFYPQLFELAHFVKEDTALLMGLAFFFLALNTFRKTGPSAFFLGAAAGLAASGKYVGLIALLIGLPFVFLAAPQDPKLRRKLIAAFLLGFLLFFAALNFYALAHPRPWARGFTREIDLFHRVENGGYVLPGSGQAIGFADLIPTTAWLFALAYLVLLMADRKQRSAAEQITAWFPFAFAAAVLLAGKESDRYFLPAGAMLMYLCALGIVDLAARLARKIATRPALPFALLLLFCLVLVLPAETRSLSASYSGFQIEHHKKLIDFVTASLPPDAVIVAERRTGLVAPASEEAAPVPQKIIAAEFAPDRGTLARLRAQGVTHVAVLEDNVVRFRDLPANEATQKWALYHELVSDGTLVFSLPREPVRFLNPGLQLYQIAP